MHYRNTRITSMARTSCKALALAVAIAACLPVCAAALEPEVARETAVAFNIPAGDLSVALERFSTQSGIQAMYRQNLVTGKRAPAVSGSFSPAAALTRLLAGTGLASERVNDRTYVLKPTAKQKRAGPSEKSGQEPAGSVRNETRENDVQEIDRMIVVGSRLGSSPVESALPIKVITREDIDRLNVSSIAQVLTYLPEVSVNNVGDRGIGDSASAGGNINSSTVQLRGLPRGTTLVLINGRRAGESSATLINGQFDLSTIPLALVDRIEVLTAGASAVYGGDGLAGVVNIVLRKNADGFDVRTSYTDAKGYSAWSTSALYGKAWESGGITAMAAWGESSGLKAAERSMTSNLDYTRFGGRDSRSPLSNPGTVYSLRGCPAGATYCSLAPARRQPLPGLSSPYAQVPGQQDGSDLNIADFVPTSGTLGRSSYNYQNLFSEESKKSLSFNLDQHLPQDVDLFVEIAYSARDIPAYELPLIIDSANGVVGRVSAENPFNPFGERVGIKYRYQDTGVYREFGQSYLRSVVGVKRDGKRAGWEISAWQNKDRSTVNGASFFSEAAISEALSSSDPNSSLNPFVGDGTAPGSRELIASLAEPIDAEYVSISRGVTGNVRGALKELPAGPVTGLAGFDYTRYELETSDPIYSQVKNQPNGSSSARSVFAEIRLPILSGTRKGMAPSLVTTGAFRRDWSDKFEGHGDSSTLGLEFKPWEDLNIRASYSSAFKPLLNFDALGELRIDQGGHFDPVSQEDVTYEIYVSGGVPNGIKPERSTSKTIGFNYRVVDDWSLSMNIWKNHLQDRIAGVAAGFFIENEQHFPGRVIRDPVSGHIVLVDQRRVNIFSTDVTGADVTVEGVMNTPMGSWHNNLSGSYAYKYDEQVVPGAPTVSNVGILRSGGWAPKWKIVYRSDLQFHQLASANIAARYVSAYRDRTTYSIGENAGEYPELGGFWTIDIGFDLNIGSVIGIADGFFKEARLKLGVRNLTENNLDFCASCTYWGYDASQYDIIGRAYQAEIRASF